MTRASKQANFHSVTIENLVVDITGQVPCGLFLKTDCHWPGILLHMTVGPLGLLWHYAEDDHQQQ